MKFDGEELNIENALKRLEEIAARLENEKNSLEESLKLYKKGVLLCNACEEELNNAELYVKQFDGEENLEE